MNGNGFVSYLNTLHNYNAQNQNSYGEMNVNNQYFQHIMVDVPLNKWIQDRICNEEPHAIILTGHAGDGKTSIMYQVLSEIGIDKFESKKKEFDYHLKTGKICRCIKDFSEIADENKAEVLLKALQMPQQGNYTFIVANTGPLITTFGELFKDEDKAEKAKIQLINAMDNNAGDIENIYGFKICVINVAAVDNTYFATEFLEKILKDELWTDCVDCPKNAFCHIYRNKNLIQKNRDKVFEFLNMHYIWITEHGKRLTIRSMTEQIAYMFTGGKNCEEVIKMKSYQYLFVNLFFGYIGTVLDKKAQNILAVKEANSCGYDRRRLRSDERLTVALDLTLFGKEMAQILLDASNIDGGVSGWNEFLRRSYFFTNIVIDEDILKEDLEDIFSRQFAHYLSIRNGGKPSKEDSNLICDALSMIYIGAINDNAYIPITLSRESGIMQNVQLMIDEIPMKNIKIIPQLTQDSSFSNKKERYILKISVNKNVLDTEISLPMLDYFEDLKNGIISTNIDPQLSHGIESLKAELSQQTENEDETFEMIILRNNGNKIIELEITEDGKLCAI